jgi:hypothetical protein
MISVTFLHASRARGAPVRVWQFTLPLGRWNS